MKSLGATGLILLGTMVWVASAAHAQSGAYPSTLLPWSGTARASGVQPAGYDSNPMGGSSATRSGNSSEQTGYRSEFDEALHAPCCEEFDACGDGCDRKWYASAYALVMTRNRAPAFWTTNTANDPFNLLMNTQDARADWAGGGQVTLGYAWRGCGGPSLAITYWGLTPMNGAGSVTDATGNPATALNSTLNWTAATINGNPATLYFDNAQQQAVWRQDTVNNVEFNFQTDTHTVNSYQIAGLAGFRYFRFTDDLTYGSASFGNSFNSNGGADAAYLKFQCVNNLFGGQLGAAITSVLTERLTAFAVPKVGIYGNQMNNQALLYTGDTVNTPQGFKTHKSDVSGLSELDLGFTWAYRPDWRLTCGYRVISVTNLSLADNQFGAYNHVEQSGSLILHGAFFGFGWMF